MSNVKSFKDLILWQKAHNLVLKIYDKTQNFPASEIYGLTSQMRRAAYSIPANIVEGHARNTKKDFVRFLHIAKSSLEELKYFTLLAYDLNYIDKSSYNELDKLEVEVSKILYTFTNNLINKTN